jgi:hypothetical protein
MMHMSNAPSLTGTHATVAINTVVLWITLVVTAIGMLATLGAGAGSVVSVLVSKSAALTLVVDKKLPAAALGGGHTVAHGSYSDADVQVNLHPDAVGFLTAADISATLVQAALFGIVALLAWRLLRGRAFRRSLANAISFAGSVVIVGELVTVEASGIASGMAASALNHAAGVQFWPLEFTLDFSNVGIGFLLLIIGLAFEYGARLQKDTEGLV